MELPPVESLQNDRCKFMESGKVLTKISNKSYCFQAYRTTNWHLCYVIRTSDDALIIFTAPEKGIRVLIRSLLLQELLQFNFEKRACITSIGYNLILANSAKV